MREKTQQSTVEIIRCNRYKS